MRKVLILLFILSLKSFHCIAQQDPEFSQYMYNMSVINPAYATNDVGLVNGGLLYRAQWVGAVGSPNTATAFLRTSLNERVEMGLSIIHDEIGDGALTEDNAYADFAYLLKLDNELFLSLGIKAGLTSFSTRFNDFQLNSGGFSSDPAFAQNINEIFLNFGTGIFLFNDDFYVGLSVPNFLSNRHLQERNGLTALGSEGIHGFLTAGYIFSINENLKFKPSCLVKGVSNAPLSTDVNANFLFNERFEIGASYRWDDSVIGMANFDITENIRIGYSYDYTISNLGNFNSGSHEIILLFNFNISNTRRYSSPRFF